MRNPIIVSALILGLGPAATGQSDWCVPVVDVANSSMSGIMNVSLNGTPALDRSSPTTEGYLHAGNTTTLVRGSLYTLSIDKDAGIDCLDLNIRAYIDFNGDHVFSESTETVALLNYAGDGVDDFTFIVPFTAVDGPTRLRVCEKQMMECGMVPINSCGIGDTLSYRGEIEDYTITIGGQVGMAEQSGPLGFAIAVLDGNIFLSMGMESLGDGAASVVDLMGRTVLDEAVISRISNSDPVLLGHINGCGAYLVRLDLGGRQFTQKIWVE